MARKAVKETLGQQYARIMGEKGFSPEEYTVLSFEFGWNGGSGTFHFWLMQDTRFFVYYLFDGCESTANVIVPREGDSAGVVRDIAAKVGGVEKKPCLS